MLIAMYVFLKCALLSRCSRLGGLLVHDQAINSVCDTMSMRAACSSALKNFLLITCKMMQDVFLTS